MLSRPNQRRKGPVQVSVLLRYVRRRLETDFRDIWVEGEVGDIVRPRSGHVYFALRDPKYDAVMRAVMWSSDVQRLKALPKEGELIRAFGSLTLYESRGAFQMRVTRLVPAGQGDLLVRFEKLKAKLEAEGLLAAERKRPLPPWPKTVGVVTSRDGAALRDILKVLRSRANVSILLAHAAVQGESAPQEIVTALKRLGATGVPDVTIVGRGGGSGDDLWAFNDERVAYAIAAHPVPVISAVGHQVDVTIADLVADRRAATPSEAALLVAPEKEALQSQLKNLKARLDRAARAGLRERRIQLERLDHSLPDGLRILDGPRQKVDELARRSEEAQRLRLAAAHRVLSEHQNHLARVHPKARLERDRTALATLRGALNGCGQSLLEKRKAKLVMLGGTINTRGGSLLERRKAQLATLGGELNACAGALLEKRKARLGELAASLDALSPLAVLSRGYALTFDADGAVVRAAGDVSDGDYVKVRLGEGALHCEVRGRDL